MKINLNNILFLDIETVPIYEKWEEVPEIEKELFTEKTKYQRKETSPEDFYEKAGIWAEFGKIICISVGYFKKDKNKTDELRVTSFYKPDEKELLTDFKFLLDKHFSKPKNILCAHNGKEFDFPYIARRMIINGIEIPKKLDLFAKKPWEIPHLDTLELWKFGDYKHYTSLKLLTYVLRIPSPKNEIDGSQVRDIYYEKKDLNRIVDYCEEDTIAVAQTLLKLNNLPILEEVNIIKIQ